MKYTFKKLPGSIIELEITLDAKEFLDNYLKPINEEMLAKVEIKGFRPGTAPKELAQKAVDPKKVFEEAASTAIREKLKSIAEENEWQLIDQAKIEIVDSGLPRSLTLERSASTEAGASQSLKGEGGLKFKATLTLFPEINLGDYKKIVKKILKNEKGDVSVNDEEVQQSIDWLRKSRAKIVRVEREAKMDDVVDIEFSGSANDKPVEGASGKIDQFILGEGKFIPGFEEKIIGHKTGENLEFKLRFPKDYWKEELKDKEVDFKVKLNGVFERQLPEINDEFAKNLGKFENVEGLRKSIREGSLKEKSHKEQEKIRLKIVDEIIRNAKIDMPQIMVDRTLENMVADYKSFADKISQKKEGNDERIKNLLKEKAKNSVATNLVLYQIAKSEKLEPTKEEVEEKSNELLKHDHAGQIKKVDSQQLYNYSYGEVRNNKVFQFLENLR